MPAEWTLRGQGRNTGEEQHVSSVRLESNGWHDHVHVWNRGAHSGVLTTKAGDGEKVARMLVTEWEVVT